MKNILTLIVVALLYSSAATAQTVQQSPVFVTPGHVATWVTNGVIGDAGTAQAPTITSLGTVGQGSTICANSGPQTGAYNQLCLGANLGTAAQIVLQNFGGAAAQTLNFVINGVSYTFPFVATGVVGPGSTTVGDVVCWNNTIGTLVSDCTRVSGPVSTTLNDLVCWNSTTGVVVSDCTTFTFPSSNLKILGSSTGVTSIASGNSGASNFTWTIPAATDQSVGRATTDTLTNKTITSSTNSLGGVTAAFGSDAKGDLYVNGGSSNVITRLAVGSSGQCLGVSSGLPAWQASCGSNSLTVNSTTVSGGSAGNLLYTDSALLQATGGITFPGTGQLVHALGTITTNTKAISITGTYNAVGTTFDAPLFENITNTASANGSLLFDFQVGGSTIFSLQAPDNAGTGLVLTNADTNSTAIVVNNTSSGGKSFSFFSSGSAIGAGFFGIFNNTDTTSMFYMSSPGGNGTAKLSVVSSAVFDWTNSTTSAASTADTSLSRDSAGVVDVGTGAQGSSAGTIKAAQATLTSLANSATTSAVCYNTGTGVLTYDGTIGTCNTSSIRFKHDIQPFTENALSAVLKMRPKTFLYNEDQHASGQQLGLIAEDLAAIDPRLVSYDDSGQPNAIRYLGPMFSYLIGAIQQQQHEIDNLKRRVR